LRRQKSIADLFAEALAKANCRLPKKARASNLSGPFHGCRFTFADFF
jgi:hypothetical protein